MTKHGEIETLGLEERDQTPHRSGGLVLRVMGEIGFAAHPLPASGEVVIGRSQDADIRIDDVSISRKHAVLRLSSEGVATIEDLGSANGTRVREQKLTPHQAVEVSTGDLIDLGSVMMILQPGAAAPRPRRLWTHSYFEGRLEDECARAGKSGGQLAVARVHVDRPLDKATIIEAFAAVVGPTDVMAEYGPDDYELLLIDSSDPRRILESVTRRIEAATYGLAIYPRDGRTPETLIAAACNALRPGAAAGDAILGAAGGIVIEDGAMQRAYRLIDRIAQGTISVLLLGETGVGKEVVAEQVHRRSPRKDRPFLRLNCGAFTETLLESELFGYEKGAFTGAERAKPGLLETAEGGTVFLDEVGELSHSLQVKLLRVLEDKKVQRIGGLEPRAIDVRFVAATNRNLEEEVRAGRFRQDLFFRLNGISLVIPPLRERTTEIIPLARALIRAAAEQSGMPVPSLSDDAKHALERYGWPGNIRELRNFMERAVLLAAGEEINLEHLPMEKMETALASASSRLAVSQGSLESELDSVEKKRILDALERCAGNQTKAAEMLGISRGTLLLRLEKYDLPRPRKGKR